MKIRSMRSLVLVLVFISVTSLMSGLVALTLGRVRLQHSTTYHAVFIDVSGLKKGVDVRAAGVTLGTVEGLHLRADDTVEVTFTVPTGTPVTEATTAAIRWANLTGDRYLELEPGASAARAAALPPGATIPTARTAPALDLDTVFNGFKPLLQALSPKDVNQLTANIIEVTQGESGAVDSLLAQVGSFTSTIADRDALIGNVIDNLSSVLGTVNAHSAQVDHLLGGLAGLLHGLAADKSQIGASVDQIGSFAGKATGLLQTLRPDIKDLVTQTGLLSSNIDDGSAYVDHVLQEYPTVIHKLGRGGTYGSFFNFYLCGIRVKTGTNEDPVYTPWQLSKEARCTF